MSVLPFSDVTEQVDRSVHRNDSNLARMVGAGEVAWGFVLPMASARILEKNRSVARTGERSCAVES